VTDLTGRTCLISGAGTGIGRVLAVRYAAAGATVVLLARRLELLEETAALVRSRGGEATTVDCDLRDEAAIGAAVGHAVREHGGIDVLLNNAAIPGTDHPVAEMDLDDWNDTLATNLTGPMLLSREVLRQSMLGAGEGNIQFFSSAAAKAVLPGKSHYAAAKLALLPLAQTLAMEVGDRGIRVNTLVIGTVTGELVDAWVDRVAAAEGVDPAIVLGRLTQSAALRRLVSPEEIAATSLWLASDAASAITGQDINVTAGAEKR
jgi:NAD(P)-dependent dehydrogenase (short-subunit alcohol dehydrogenase family)